MPRLHGSTEFATGSPLHRASGPATADGIDRFSAQLYCSGAEEQRCAVQGGARRAEAGRCHWWRRSEADGTFSPLADDANSSTNKGQKDRWMPDFAGFRRFGPAESGRCMRGKRLLIVGDSTTRDTFHVLLAVAGRSIWKEVAMRRHVWNESEWLPRMPLATRALDKYGICNGDQTSKPPMACTRDVLFNAQGALLSANSSLDQQRRAARVSYQYVMSNDAWEMDILHGLMRRHDFEYDAALVQCPLWTTFMPRAYNRSATKAVRHKIERHATYDDVGANCKDIIRRIRRHSPRAAILMLGLSALPTGSQAFKNIHLDEPKLFASMHNALGIACVRSAANDFDYELSSQMRVVPIDRYNLWKNRKRDTIHPFYNAQFALVQLIFNHLCPGEGLVEEVRLPTLAES